MVVLGMIVVPLLIVVLLVVLAFYLGVKRPTRIDD